tara:strand:- start:167 stop:580 length:414 start_codon:yes stop_codon:yes gene_type:complete
MSTLQDILKEAVSPNNLSYVCRMCDTYITKKIEEKQLEIDHYKGLLKEKNFNHLDYTSIVWHGVVYHIFKDWNKKENGAKVIVYDLNYNEVGHFFAKENYNGSINHIIFNEEYYEVHKLNVSNYKLSYDNSRVIHLG